MTIRQPADGRRLDFVALGPRIGDNVNMVWQETPFTVPLIIGAHIAMIASFFVPRGRSVPGTLSARVMLIASALWTGSYAAEMACATLDGKILCNKIEYCGIVVVPFTLLGFAFAYSGRMDLVTKRRAILASVIPAITLVLVFTNDAHHLIWTNNILVSNGSYVIMRNTYGACFYLYVVYIYISMALAAGLVLQLLFRSPHMYATQATALLLTVGVPWVANILYVTKATPFPDFDLTPLSFSIASVAMVWGISGLRVGDMVSVSRGVALDGISDALFVLDNDDRVAHCNLAARTLTEKPSYHIVGQPIEKLLPEWPFSRISDLNPYQSSKTTASRRPVTVRSRDSALDLGCAEMVLKTAIGKNTYEVRLSAINDWRGREISKVAIIRDISDRKHLEEELDRRYVEARRLAENDPVTGLYNHRVFHQKLELEIRRTQRTSRPISVIIMDIDGFKLFNDTYGHPVGDNILRSIAILLVKTAREIDILARYGGDEFVAILPETDMDGAKTFAERIREGLAIQPYVANDESIIPLRMSFGIATCPQDARQGEALVAFADSNLYESKQRGGNFITSAGETADDGAVKLGNYSVLDGLVTAVDRKDRYTRKHSEDVTAYALALARAIGLSEENLRTVRIAALLHDLGKIGVPDQILRKPGKLDAAEYEIVKQHAVLGEMIIKDVPNLPDVLDAVVSHHERYDGSGYPRGLKGEDIPLLGRILAVADAYSAMTSDRPYRQAKSRAEAEAELLRVAGTHLDAQLVEVFVSECLPGHGETLPKTG